MSKLSNRFQVVILERISMIDQHHAEVLLETLAESNTIAELNSNLTKICNHYNIDKFSITTFFNMEQPTKGFDYFETYPPEWVAHYVENQYYLHDPAHGWGKIRMPFSWDGSKLENLTPIQSKMFYEAHDFNVKAGTTISLLPRQEEQSFLTILDVMHPHPEITNTLTMAAQLYWNTKRILDAKHTLSIFTTRELEVLFFKSQGMPIKVVADRLAISESTVIFHLKNARHKLNASSVDHTLFLFGKALAQSSQNGFKRKYSSLSNSILTQDTGNNECELNMLLAAA